LKFNGLTLTVSENAGFPRSNSLIEERFQTGTPNGLKKMRVFIKIVYIFIQLDCICFKLFF